MEFIACWSNYSTPLSCSFVYDPLGDMLHWLESLISGDTPSAWLVDMEGEYFSFLSLPKADGRIQIVSHWFDDTEEWLDKIPRNTKIFCHYQSLGVEWPPLPNQKIYTDLPTETLLYATVDELIDNHRLDRCVFQEIGRTTLPRRQFISAFHAPFKQFVSSDSAKKSKEWDWTGSENGYDVAIVWSEKIESWLNERGCEEIEG
ncbi:MAG: hypothetical protein HQL69_16160 [Magnetococcales bacterium]|nr:hypothetical protein [Magnetococcales bacterium]